MRPKVKDRQGLTGAQCARAWGSMQRGASLVKAASQIGVAPSVLDLSLWNWRAAQAGAKSVPSAAVD